MDLQSITPCSFSFRRIYYTIEQQQSFKFPRPPSIWILTHQQVQFEIRITVKEIRRHKDMSVKTCEAIWLTED
jgi:hypothetical protein